MTRATDNTKEVLELLLAGLYAEQNNASAKRSDSYLIAQDKQFLGRITDNQYDKESILNEYGPYGSQYSQTSIFNPYSQYGSEYGHQSLNNPYCSTPPQLIINGQFIGHVSKNPYVHTRIPTEAFLYTLKNSLSTLLAGKLIESEEYARVLNKESFIIAADDTFLGKLNPNRFDVESIFNKFGPYGNKYSDTSIFNKFSNYGSVLSNLSPFNTITRTPPKVFVKGKYIGYLTVNQTISNRIDPNQIFDWAQQNVQRY